MSTSQQSKKPQTQENSKKPWYEDRWYDEPLNLQFRKFDESEKPGYKKNSADTDNTWRDPDKPLDLKFRNFADRDTVKEGYERVEPPKSDKPWYEDRWYDKPLDMQFRNFDDDKPGQGPGKSV